MSYLLRWMDSSAWVDWPRHPRTCAPSSLWVYFIFRLSSARFRQAKLLILVATVVKWLMGSHLQVAVRLAGHREARARRLLARDLFGDRRGRAGAGLGPLAHRRDALLHGDGQGHDLLGRVQ